MRKQNKTWIGVLLLLVLSTVLMLSSALTVFAGDGTYHTISVNVADDCTSFGTVSVTGGVKDDAGNYQFGTEVTLEAEPTAGYVFDGWYDPSTNTGISGDAVYTFAVARDGAYEARFVAKTYGIVYLDMTGANYNGQVTSHTFGQQTVIPDPSRDGYTFLGWVVNDNTEPQKGLVLTGSEAYSLDTVTLRAVWKAIAYRVIRYDFKEKMISDLGSELWKNKLSAESHDALTANYETFLGYCDTVEDGSDWLVAMGATVKGNEGTATAYRGYHFEDAVEFYTDRTVTITNESNLYVNKIFRVYRPNVYDITYVNAGNPVQWEKTTHTYDTATEIGQYPTRVGYTFIGWNVNGTDVPLNTAQGESLTLGATEFVEDITLTALWTPNRYAINYDLAGGVLNEKPTEHEYDTETQVPNPTYTGYTFVGWKVNGTLVSVDASAGESLTLAATEFTATISLEAQWIPNVYHVTFAGEGATVPGILKTEVTFDQLPDGIEPQDLPTRTGYTFMGYYSGKAGSGEKYFNADGTAAHVWDIAADTTLYAYWKVNQYEVSVNVNDATVTFTYGGNTHTFTDNRAMIDYGTEITLTVTANAGSKLVQWNAAAVSHQAVFTYTFTLGAEDVALTGVVVSTIAVPTFTVNYISDPELLEVEGGLPEGRYRIFGEGLPTLEIVVSEHGEIEINGERATRIRIPEEYFGQTVYVVRFGDGVTAADSDPTPVLIKARPSAPAGQTHIKGIYADDKVINVEMVDGLLYEYQYAISTDPAGTDLVWTSNPTFEGLNPGTIYYVFCRVTAQDENGKQNPYGEVYVHEINTNFSDYVREIIAALQALRKDGDGANVDRLLAQAIAEINDVPKPSASFYATLQGIYNRTEAAVPFARRQDEKVAALTALRDRLIGSQAFNSAAIDQLEAYYSVAVAGINAASTDDVVQRIYEAALVDMGAVKVSYVSFGDLHMQSSAGLPQKVQLTLLKFQDFATKAAMIEASIKAENLAVTDAEMAYRLRSLEVMAAYSMRLAEGGGNPFASFDGTYTFSLVIPEELRGVSGLLVAYYNERTGVLEVLDTTVDGNCLVFTASRVDNFVILGDPTLDLTWLIVLLAVILFCQLLGIMILLARRARYSTKARSTALLTATFLTVQFLPQGSITAVAILGALVILCQIVLMVLLMTSDLFYQRRRTVHYEEDAPTEERYYAYSQTMEDDTEALTEEAPALTMLTEEEIAEEDRLLTQEDEFEDPSDASALYGAEFAPDTVEEDSDAAAEEELFDEGDYAVSFEAEDAVYADTEDLEEEQEILEEEALLEGELTEEDFGEDFIEPAADPQYFLPDEEEALPEEETVTEEEIVAEEELAYVEEPLDDVPTEELDEEGLLLTEEDVAEDVPMIDLSAEDIPISDASEEELAELPAEETELVAEDVPAEEDFSEDAPTEETVFELPAKEDAYVAPLEEDDAEDVSDEDASEDAADNDDVAEEYQALPTEDQRPEEEPPYYLL